MMTNTKILPFFHLFISFYSILVSASNDILTASQSLSGNETLISAGQIYQLGLFTPPGADADILYLGIWFYNLPTKSVVWVANRDSPARNSTVVSLKLGTGGQIILAEDGASSAVWSTSNQTQATRPILQLLDTGNLVVREDGNENPNDYMWQSFDHPTDTLLPSQKLGWDKKSGLDRHLTSWKSDSDPSRGDYTYDLVRTGDPELMLKEGSRVIFRTGPWVGNWLSGVPAMYPSTSLNFTFVDTEDEVTYGFKLKDRSNKFRLTVVPGGTLNRYVWMPERSDWYLYWSFPRDQCDRYELCGPNGVCDGASSQFVCGCPRGFEPENQGEWDLLDGSHGCRRKTGLECGSDGFRAVGGMKLPMSGAAAVYKEKGLEECMEICRKNCSCMGYANREVVNGVGSGCVVWAGELLDMRALGDAGQDVYVRLAASDLGSSKTKKVMTGVGVSVGVVLLLIATVGYFVVKRRHSSDATTQEAAQTPRTTERSSDFLLSGIILSNKRDILNKKDRDDLELPLYDFNAMVLATDNFSDKNKLGEGGFGSVYKGVLTEGEEVAVKRLSKDSGQGIEEFKNEVKLIAKLQHRNLVRLLGCCVGSEEKMLLYEYMPNRSLDSILFDMDRSSILDWERRFNIICGIARGLLYLHHDSRFRIIHRDMKASNILLDSDMNPKISDFGMARIFGDEKEENNTRRVVGTYGYMSPEYAMDGLFSIKSDVFSFGVLVLEIVTGKKNRGFYNSHEEINLLGYVWKMWEEERGSELVDPSVGDSYSVDEVLRCLQLGLLCVQERPEERPNMSSVVTFLGSEAATLPQPKLPGFFFGRRPAETYTSSSQQDDSISVNQVTITIIDGR